MPTNLLNMLLLWHLVSARQEILHLPEVINLLLLNRNRKRMLKRHPLRGYIFFVKSRLCFFEHGLLLNMFVVLYPSRCEAPCDSTNWARIFGITPGSCHGNNAKSKFVQILCHVRWTVDVDGFVGFAHARNLNE